MYNVKGPSKIVAKTTRRGLPQNIDNYRDLNKNKISENDDDTIKIPPKPVFNKKSTQNSVRQEPLTPEHQEVIKFIQESWNSVCSELNETDENVAEQNKNNSRTIYFHEEDTDSLQDFKPFDLESWWGKRLYAHITNSVNCMPN